MERNEIKSIIEALIFVSEEPMSLDLMVMVLGETGLGKKEIREILEGLKNDYNENEERGIQIIEVAGGYQFRTKPTRAEWIQKLNVPKPVRLSQAAMETMAIVAYRQPCVRSQVEDVRGVDSGGVLKTLLERGLIRIIGKSDEAGNPLVYGTSKAFLEMFGLESLKELPTLREIESLEIQERVGDIGKEDTGEKVAEGVGEVIEEYKDDILSVGIDFEKEAEDSHAISRLEQSVKNLRKLEKVMFPKPKEEVRAVPREGVEINEGGALLQTAPEEGVNELQKRPTESREETDHESQAAAEEDAAPQNTGPVD